MEKIFRVPLKYGGYKYFFGDNAESEANAYEVEMKQQEIEEKERQMKEFEARKNGEVLLKEVNEAYAEFIELVNKYQDTYKKTLVYTCTDSSEKNVIKPIDDQSREWFYDNLVSELLKSFRTK